MAAFQTVVGQLNNRQTKNIIVWSGKGGSGKTTVSQNIAWWLASTGRVVGLVDTDSYANSSNFINMLTIPPAEQHTLSHVIQQNKSLLDVMYQVRKGLYVIPSDDSIDAANGFIIANEAQEIMIDRYNDMVANLTPQPQNIPNWHKVASLTPRYFPPLATVADTQIRERPEYLDYLIWDFPGEPGPLCRAILRLPNSAILAPVMLEPLPLQGFAQMRMQIDKLFRNAITHKPPIAGVIPYSITHKRPETAQEFVKLYLSHSDVFMRAVHEDLNVPPSQNYYPAQSIYEAKRTSRAARELFEIAMRLDGYTGKFEGTPACKHCEEIDLWLKEQIAVVAEGQKA